MEVQNISGSDVVAREFTPEYTSRTENAPAETRVEERPAGRAPEPNKGENIDRLA